MFEAVCRPFKVRVEQVLVAGQPGLLLAYKLCNLLAFYSNTFSGLLGAGAAFSLVLGELLQAAQRTVADIIKSRGDKLLRFPPQVESDLNPPAAVGETMALLGELLEAHSSMMVPAGVEKPAFTPILEGLLQPLKQMCERAAEGYGASKGGTGRRTGPFNAAEALGPQGTPGKGQAAPAATGSPATARRFSGPGRRSEAPAAESSQPPEVLEVARHIFLTNCLAAMHQPLAAHPVAAEQAQALASEMEEHVAAMVKKEVALLLAQCRMTPVVAAIAAGQHGGVVLAEQPEASPMAVAEALKLLFSVLARGADGHGGGLPEFAALQVPRLRSEACTLVAVAVAEAYTVVFEGVMDPSSGFPEPRTMLRHTPDQMRTILGV